MSVSTTGPDNVAQLIAAADTAGKTAERMHGLVVQLATRQRTAAPRPRRGSTAPRVRLTAWQRMQVEESRKLLLDAPDLFATRPDAYVAGLIEGAAQTLLDVLDAIAEV